MRYGLVLLALLLGPGSARAQMCGAPNAYDAWSAGQRLRRLTEAPALPDRGPYESTAEWAARTETLRADARQRAADGLGAGRTLRVGGRVELHYDADAERLWFGRDDAFPPTVVTFPDGLDVSDVANGQLYAAPEPVASLYGASVLGSGLELGWGPPSMHLSRTRARMLDPLTHAACVFFVFKIFGDDWPVLGVDRIELVSDTPVTPTVWSWTLHDGGDVTTVMESPAMEDDAMMADSTSAM